MKKIALICTIGVILIFTLGFIPWWYIEHFHHQWFLKDKIYDPRTHNYYLEYTNAIDLEQWRMDAVSKDSFDKVQVPYLDLSNHTDE